MAQGDVSAVQAFRYQVPPRLLVGGGACLFGLLALLLASGGDAGALWWAGVGVVGALLALTLSVGWVVWRWGPLEVKIRERGLEVPGGFLGASPRAIAWEHIRGLRMVGRVSAVRRGGREALYVLFEKRYVVLMSELFENDAAYGSCRAALIAAVRAHCPQARIDVDGEALPTDSIPDASAKDARHE